MLVEYNVCVDGGQETRGPVRIKGFKEGCGVMI